MNRSQSTQEEEQAPQGLRPERNPLWYWLQVLARSLFTVWFRYRARGVDRVPERGGVLLLINHQSFLDPLLVGLPLSRPVCYLARDSLFRNPAIRWLFGKTYVIPINRQAAAASSIRAAVGRLREGHVVGMFPEGTRSEDGQLGPLKSGFLLVVRRAQVPVCPVAVAGSRHAMPRNAWFVRPRRCHVVFGEPLAFEEIERYCRDGGEEEAVARIRDRMDECRREAEAWLQEAAGGPAADANAGNGRRSPAAK